jgi:hypothetical protein
VMSPMLSSLVLIDTVRGIVLKLPPRMVATDGLLDLPKFGRLLGRRWLSMPPDASSPAGSFELSNLKGCCPISMHLVGACGELSDLCF